MQIWSPLHCQSCCSIATIWHVLASYWYVIFLHVHCIYLKLMRIRLFQMVRCHLNEKNTLLIVIKDKRNQISVVKIKHYLKSVMKWWWMMKLNLFTVDDAFKSEKAKAHNESIAYIQYVLKFFLWILLHCKLSCRNSAPLHWPLWLIAHATHLPMMPFPGDSVMCASVLIGMKFLPRYIIHSRRYAFHTLPVHKP